MIMIGFFFYYLSLRYDFIIKTSIIKLIHIILRFLFIFTILLSFELKIDLNNTFFNLYYTFFSIFFLLWILLKRNNINLNISIFH